MVIANANLTGNCNRLNDIDKSEEIIGILGIKTDSPLNFPFIIMPSIKFSVNFFMISLVPLHRMGGFRFRNTMIMDPIFSESVCAWKPDGSNEFKNSTG